MKFELKKSLGGLSDEELLEELKSCANQLGQDTITMNQFEKHGKGHSTTFCRRFGSWPKALELANLKPSRSEINISDEKLFIKLQNLWLSLKRQPTYTETRKPLSKYSARTYENRFGSWSNALVEFVEWTKLDPRERGDYDDDSNNAIQLTNERTTKRTSRQISERQRFRILLNAVFVANLVVSHR